MAELSKEHLLKALTQPNNYKQTKLYIDQIVNSNEEVHSIVSEVLVAVMKSNKVSLIGKLQAMRFFKDIFEIGNFQCIDTLDQEIEDHIVSVAQYSKNSKEANRGANYFLQVQKRSEKNNNNIKQMGTSYVILALEMIKNFASWYPLDQDNEETRFVEYYRMLSKKGVVFPKTENYFKPSDEEKFKKNYAAWVKKEINKSKDQIKQQENKKGEGQEEDNKKQSIKQRQSNDDKQALKQQSKNQKQLIKQHQPNNEKHNQLQEKRKVGTKINDGKENQQQVSKNKNNEELEKQSNIDILVSQTRIIDETKLQQTNNTEQIQKAFEESQNRTQPMLNQLRNLKQENERLRKQKEQIIKSNLAQRASFESLKMELEKLISQKQALEIQLKQVKETALNKQKTLLQSLEGKNVLLKQLQTMSKKSQQHHNKQNKTVDNSLQILQSLSHEVNLKKDQILKLTESHGKVIAQKQELSAMLKKHDQTIDQQSKMLVKRQEQINELKRQIYDSSVSQEQKLQINVIQPRPSMETVQKVNLQQKSTNIDHQDNSSSNRLTNSHASNVLKNNFPHQSPCFILENKPVNDNFVVAANSNTLSMSTFLSKDVNQPLEDRVIKVMNHSPTPQKTRLQCRKSKSIGKTQNSLNKLKQQKITITGTANWNRTGSLWNQTGSLWNQTGSLWGTGNFNSTAQQLRKTGAGFEKLLKTEQSRMVSVLPFIQQYFQPVNLNQSFTFRSMCLLNQSGQSSPILSNDLVEVRLIYTPRAFIVSIQNKTNHGLQINLTSLHQQVQIEGSNKAQIVQPSRYLDFTVSLHITDLNMRFPICQLQIQSTTSISYGFPLPVTLFTFCKFIELDQTERLSISNSQNCKSYKSEKFMINKLYRSIDSCLDKLRFSSLGERKQWYGIVNYKYISDISLFMKLEQCKRACTIRIDFNPESAISDAFAKVLLQIMMFLLM